MDRLFPHPKKKSRVRMGGGSGGGGLSAAEAMSKLTNFLRKLRRAKSPAIRESLVAEARSRKDEFGPSLVKLLTEERTNPYLVEAILLAAALDLRESLDAIRGLTEHDSPTVRATAIRGADLLEPWNTEAVALLLTDSQIEPLIAALEVASRQKKRPVEAIIPLLSHPNQTVRSAALAAIPVLRPGEQLDALLDLVRRSRGKTTQAAALALAQSGLPGDSEKLLFELLDRKNWLTRKAALQALATKRSRLSRPDKIMAIIRNPQTKVRECTFALVALEQTKTIPQRELRALLPKLHPVMRLLAARCLVTVGDRAAIPVLIELLGTKMSKTVDEEDRDCSKQGARAVLRELAGHDLGPDKGPWLKWARDFALRPVQLGSKPPTFW